MGAPFQLVEERKEWSPRNSGLLHSRLPQLQAKAKYLLRDTLKVTGHAPAFPPPVAAIFYAIPTTRWPAEPDTRSACAKTTQCPSSFKLTGLTWIPDLEMNQSPADPGKYPAPSNRRTASKPRNFQHFFSQKSAEFERKRGVVPRNSLVSIDV